MASVESFATRALLAATSTNQTAAYLTEQGREGMFVWNSSDLSARVSADPQQGVYVAPSSTPLGANGAWVREYEAQLEANWFGASGAGTGNDVPFIQAAIDLAATLGGRTVFLRPGTYQLQLRASPDGVGATCIEMKSGVTLVGEDQNLSILRLAPNQLGPGTYLRIIMSQGLLQNAAIRDLQVDGNQAQQTGFTNTGNGAAILLGRSEQVAIERIVARNANGQGIQIVAPVGSVSSKIRVEGCFVSNCQGDGNSGIGIQVSQFERLIVSGNIVQDTVGNGIDLYGENGTDRSSASNFIVSDNIITNADNGIFPETSRSGIVTGNTMTQCRSAGIRINRINGAPSLLQIVNNQVDTTPTSLAITGDADRQSGIMVEGNFFSNFYGAGGGVVFGGSSANVSYVVVRNNTFAPATTTVPLVLVAPGTNQVAFIRVYDNQFQGVPNPGYRFVNYAATTYRAYVGGWIGLEDVSGDDLERRSILTENLAISAPDVPSSSGTSGRKGQIAYDSGYIYVCVDSGNWKRAALTNF